MEASPPTYYPEQFAFLANAEVTPTAFDLSNRPKSVRYMEARCKPEMARLFDAWLTQTALAGGDSAEELLDRWKYVKAFEQQYPGLARISEIDDITRVFQQLQTNDQVTGILSQILDDHDKDQFLRALKKWHDSVRMLNERALPIFRDMVKALRVYLSRQGGRSQWSEVLKADQKIRRLKGEDPSKMNMLNQYVNFILLVSSVLRDTEGLVSGLEIISTTEAFKEFEPKGSFDPVVKAVEPLKDTRKHLQSELKNYAAAVEVASEDLSGFLNIVANLASRLDNGLSTYGKQLTRAAESVAIWAEEKAAELEKARNAGYLDNPIAAKVSQVAELAFDLSTKGMAATKIGAHVTFPIWAAGYGLMGVKTLGKTLLNANERLELSKDRIAEIASRGLYRSAIPKNSKGAKMADEVHSGISKAGTVYGYTQQALSAAVKEGLSQAAPLTNFPGAGYVSPIVKTAETLTALNLEEQNAAKSPQQEKEMQATVERCLAPLYAGSTLDMKGRFQCMRLTGNRVIGTLLGINGEQYGCMIDPNDYMTIHSYTTGPSGDSNPEDLNLALDQLILSEASGMKTNPAYMSIDWSQSYRIYDAVDGRTHKFTYFGPVYFTLSSLTFSRFSNIDVVFSEAECKVIILSATEDIGSLKTIVDGTPYDSVGSGRVFDESNGYLIFDEEAAASNVLVAVSGFSSIDRTRELVDVFNNWMRTPDSLI